MGGVPYATVLQSFASERACKTHVEQRGEKIIENKKKIYPQGAIQHWQLECQKRDAGKEHKKDEQEI